MGISHQGGMLSFLGWAWVLGGLGAAGVIGLWLCAVPENMGPGIPAAGMLALALLGFWKGRRAGEAGVANCAQKATGPRREWVFWSLFVLSLVFVLDGILQGSLFAVATTDEAAFWSFRANVLFHEHGFGAAFGEGIRQTQQGNADYPLLNPLLQLWAYVASGGIVHLANRYLIVAF